MRTASICPTCAVYYNALCVIYGNSFLESIGVNTGDNLELALQKINNAIIMLQGTSSPSSVPSYIGQLYLNTSNDQLWVALSNTINDWGLIGTIITTTSTTTSSTTSTTTSHP